MIRLKHIPKFGEQFTGQVRPFQQRLFANGFDPGAMDDRFGQNTLNACSRFQKSRGLTGTGHPGPKTMELLGILIGDEQAEPVTRLPGVLPISSITISTGTDPGEGTRPWYRKMWAGIAIDEGQDKAVKVDGDRIAKGRKRYEIVSKAVWGTEEYWWVVAALNYRESDGSFDRVLHNGEKLTDVNKNGTTLVPKGLGKGLNWTWEQAAIAALKGESIGNLKSFEIGDLAYALERYNGAGYIDGKGKEDTSPYLWARTNVNDGYGQYVKDGKYDPNSPVNGRSGVMALFLYWEVQGLIKIESLEAPVESPAPTKTLTRQQIAETIVRKIQDDIDLKLRETGGHNRGKRIDYINQRAGTYLGAPYCASGIWVAIDDACIELGLKNPVPKTASSQAFGNGATAPNFLPKKYIRAEGSLGQVGDVAVLTTASNKNQGHVAVVREDQVKQPDFNTVEYNTDGSGTRDGDGAYQMSRNTIDKSKENAGKLFRCFTDIPQWILEHNA